MNQLQFPLEPVGDGRPKVPTMGTEELPARRYFDMYVSQPDDDAPFVAEDTLRERDRVRNAWVK